MTDTVFELFTSVEEVESEIEKVNGRLEDLYARRRTLKREQARLEGSLVVNYEVFAPTLLWREVEYFFSLIEGKSSVKKMAAFDPNKDKSRRYKVAYFCAACDGWVQNYPNHTSMPNGLVILRCTICNSLFTEESTEW